MATPWSPPGGGARRRRSTPRCPCCATLDHEVSRRGAYLAYIGSGEHAVRLRVLGDDVAAPRAAGRSYASTCRSRCRCCPATGTCSARPGATRPSAAARCSTSHRCVRRRGPARTATVDRVVAERGWVDADELELLTGERARADRRALGGHRRSRCSATVAAIRRACRRGRAARRRAGGARRARARRRWRRLDDVAVDAARVRRVRRRRPAAPTTRSLAALAAGGLAPDRADRRQPGRTARAGAAAACSSSATGCGSTPTPSTQRPRLRRRAAGRPTRRASRSARSARPPASPASTPCRCSPSSTPGASPAAAATSASPVRAARRTLTELGADATAGIRRSAQGAALVLVRARPRCRSARRGDGVLEALAGAPGTPRRSAWRAARGPAARACRSACIGG